MIRPNRLLAPALRRCLSHSTSSNTRGTANPVSKTTATALKSSSRPRRWKKAAPSPRPPPIVEQDTPKGAQHVMLTISGLSPSLAASDFDRLAARSLSDWNAAITEFAQERDPWTLEPLGTYRLSFTSGHAAFAYRCKLTRLHRLAALKLHSNTPLWEATVPPALRNGTASPADELASFALAPGSQPQPLAVAQSRIRGRFAWQKLIEHIAAQSAFPRARAAILLELDKACLTAKEMETFVRADEAARNLPWAVGSPYHLVRTLHEDELDLAKGKRTAMPDDPDFMSKLRRRFVLVCENEDVAWRFIRNWNQRELTGVSEGYVQRTVVNASLIEW